MPRAILLSALLLLALGVAPRRALGDDLQPAVSAHAPVYIWFEPEWFPDVTGRYDYWTGPGVSKPMGAWGIAGPGISAEWSQGGESGWNSMGAAAEETHAVCHRDFTVPRAAHYNVWVRYVDHRLQTSPFTVQVMQGGKPGVTAEMGVQHAVSPNDEFELYWGFSFAWAKAAGTLTAGPATIRLVIDKPGQSWRQVDAVLITDDAGYIPNGREKPPFAYFKAFDLEPAATGSASWRGSAQGLAVGSSWATKRLGGRDFMMWADITPDAKWWSAHDPAKVSLYDAFFGLSAPSDIADAFHKQFAGRKDVPIMSWPGLVPGLYLGNVPDLSPGTNLYKWLVQTKTPFYMMTNYANPAYTDKTGPATYQALTGPLASQFLGYIHGEAMGTLSVSPGDKQLGKTRREEVDAMAKKISEAQAAEWSKFYKTSVPPAHRAKSIPCLSCDSIALAHLFHESGCDTVGYEVDSTNIHVPMRIAFERGAARQYGGAWLNYASSNFGDSCNEFSQNPNGNRGAGAWYVNKYAITDGVSSAWYRRLYYTNYLGGAAAIFWEQGLANQWIKPGPGTWPVDLSPFGRATVDFQNFVDRVHDRGQPYTPIAFLLSYGNGFDYVNYNCKMLNYFPEDDNDRELRELFNVAWFPSPILEGKPQAPDVQSMPSGVYGDIFDVLVDRPGREKAIMGYPVVWAAGDADLGGKLAPALEDYVNNGGTLVLNVATARNPAIAKLLGVTFTGKKQTFDSWLPGGDAQAQPATPYEVEGVELGTAKALAWAKAGVPLITRNQVGQGAVILTLVPHMLGLDERAHPALPYLMNGLTENLMPVEVVTPDGKRLDGQVQVQINRTHDGYLVGLLNNRGVDKTPSGIARVDRRQFADVVVRTRLNVAAAKEYTQPRDLAVAAQGTWHEVRIRVEAGDVQVVGLVTK